MSVCDCIEGVVGLLLCAIYLQSNGTCMHLMQALWSFCMDFADLPLFSFLKKLTLEWDFTVIEICFTWQTRQ